MKGSKHNNERLVIAGIAFVLAGLAIAIVSPDGLNGVNKHPNFIGVLKLAEKIKNREKFRLIDLRDSASFAEFHIPTAQNISLENVNLKNIEGAIVFYSGDDLLARRLWDSLPNSMRDRTTILYGGVRDWYERLLYPTLPFGDQVKDSVLLMRIHNLSGFYGGFADFEQDSSLMEYYKANLSKVQWPKMNREGNLARKGC